MVQTSQAEKRTALVTGASSGIGYELAKVFAREGYHVVLVARRAEKLKALAREIESKYSVSARVLVADLTRPTAPEEIYREIKQDSVEVDILVNNAGFGVYGPFAETPLEKELELLQVNMVALTHLTKLFLPGMIQRKYGKILNVASTAAFQPGPTMSTYYASKAYVLSFSEAIRAETRPFGVTVTTSCPGPTNSGFLEAANLKDVRLFKFGVMDSQTVAEQAYTALMKGKGIIVHGLFNRFFALGAQLAPRFIVTAVVNYIQQKRPNRNKT